MYNVVLMYMYCTYFIPKFVKSTTVNVIRVMYSYFSDDIFADVSLKPKKAGTSKTSSSRKPKTKERDVMDDNIFDDPLNAFK